MLIGVAFSAMVVGATLAMTWGALVYGLGKRYGDESLPVIVTSLMFILGVGIGLMRVLWEPASYWTMVLATMAATGTGLGLTYGILRGLFVSIPMKERAFYLVCGFVVLSGFIVAPTLLKAH